MTVASLDYSPAARLTCQDLGGEVLGDGEWAHSRGGGVRRADPGAKGVPPVGPEESVPLEVRPRSGPRCRVSTRTGKPRVWQSRWRVQLKCTPQQWSAPLLQRGGPTTAIAVGADGPRPERVARAKQSPCDALRAHVPSWEKERPYRKAAPVLP